MTYHDLNINQRINYKGYQQLKDYVLRPKHNNLKWLLCMSWDTIIHAPHLYNRYYSCLGESNSYKGWKKHFLKH